MTASRTPRRVTQALKNIFGLQALRRGQRAVIDRVFGGQPTLAIMPTGAGKSLCYQLPAALAETRTVVISPLIALMKDQCDKLCQRGLAAVQWHSGLTAAQQQQAQAQISDGTARIVFATPEQTADAEFVAALRAREVGLLVVDEAHCAVQWGHDFRPAFLGLQQLRGALGKPTVLALTATANDAVAAEICALLAIPAAGVLRSGVLRPNLHYRVDVVADAAAKLRRALDLVKASTGPGIVYASTVRAAAVLTAELQAADVSVALYHGKLGIAERTRVQDAFLTGAVRVMVATNAFGLGIDKPDIRFVLHLQLPPGLDAYYQESGRAGRDGADASCTLLYLRGDRSVQQFFMAGRYPDRAALAQVAQHLQGGAPNGSHWSLSELASAARMPPARVAAIVAAMRSARLLQRSARGTLAARPQALDGAALDALAQAYAQRRGQDEQALEEMVFYAQAGRCRWQLLLRHFEPDADAALCGHCDSCTRLRLLQAAETPAPEPAADGPATPPQPAAAARLQPGCAVKVRRYGRGELVADEGGALTIRFPGGQQRSFHPDFVLPAGRPKRLKASALQRPPAAPGPVPPVPPVSREDPAAPASLPQAVPA